MKNNVNAYENNGNGTFERNSAAELKGSSSIYFRIPASIILDRDSDERRISAFSFFSIRRGLDNSVTFTVNGMAKWLNKKPDRHAGGTNDKLAKETMNLAKLGYLSLSEKIGNTSEVDAVFNLSKVSEECTKDNFSIVYLDELEKILKYDSKGTDAILLVFSYLRMRIARRRNKLFNEESSDKGEAHDIKSRQVRTPEAYDCYLYEMADELGLSTRVVSNAVDALNEMKLIYSEQLPKTSNNGKWQTNRTIFCNWYKREKGSLFAYGKDYYMQEVKNKKIRLMKLK